MTPIKPGTVCLVVPPPPGYTYVITSMDLKYCGTCCTVVGPMLENNCFTGGYIQECKMFDGLDTCVARICLVPITPPSMPENERTDKDVPIVNRDDVKIDYDTGIVTVGEFAVNC